MLAVLEAAGNSTGGGVLAQVVTKQADGTPVITMALAAPENATELVVSQEGVQVSVPSSLLSGGVVALSLAKLGPGSSGHGLLNASTPGGLRSDPLGMSMFANGSAITELGEPMRFTLPSSEGQAACAYWDTVLNAWSTEGVTIINSTGSHVICETTHLSLFSVILSVIVSTFACSNAAAIFSAAGLYSLVERPWPVEWPAILNWITLLAGAIMLRLARRADQKHRPHLKVMKKVLSVKEHHTDHHHGLAHLLHELGAAASFRPTRFIYSQLIQKQVGTSLKALDTMYDRVGHSSLHQQAEKFVMDYDDYSLRQKLMLLYEVNCRWFTFAHPSSQSTCTVRCAVLLSKIYSGWAVSAIFYGASAISPGQDNGCSPLESLLERVVRSAVISFVSAVVGSLPFVALLVLYYRVHRISKAIRGTMFWVFTICYFACCFLVVCIFIASVSSDDGQKWFITSFIGILTSLLLVCFGKNYVPFCRSFELWPGTSPPARGF